MCVTVAQSTVNVVNECTGLRCSSFIPKVTDPPHKQIAPMSVTAQPMQTYNIVISTLQPSEGLNPVAGTHGLGCRCEVDRAHMQPSAFLCLADVETKGRGVPTRCEIIAKCQPRRKVIFFQSSQLRKKRITVANSFAASTESASKHSKSWSGHLQPT